MKRSEQIALGLRTRGGVPSRWLEQRPNERDEFVALGLLRSRNGNFVLTRAGKLLADTVAEALSKLRRNAAGARPNSSTAANKSFFVKSGQNFGVTCTFPCRKVARAESWKVAFLPRCESANPDRDNSGCRDVC